MSRRCAACLAMLITMPLVLSQTSLPVGATVTVGGGSADFMLKTYVAGQVGAAQQVSYDPSSGWSSRQIPANMTQTPALVTYNSQLWVIALSTDQQLYATYLVDPTNNVWSSWAALPALANGVTSAPTAITYTNGPGGSSAINVFVRGGDNGIWQIVYGGGAWGAWSSPAPGATLGSAPAVVNYTGTGDTSRVDIMWLDSASQNYMHLIYSSSGGWSAPSADGCCYTSAPAVAQYQSTFQEWGVGTDGKLYQRVYSPSGGWSGYTSWSNDVAGSAPAVTQYGSQFQVFYVMGGAMGRPGTWQGRQLVYDPNAGGWLAPAYWHTFITSAPAALQSGTQLQLGLRDGRPSTCAVVARSSKRETLRDTTHLEPLVFQRYCSGGASAASPRQGPSARRPCGRRCLLNPCAVASRVRPCALPTARSVSSSTRHELPVTQEPRAVAYVADQNAWAAVHSHGHPLNRAGAAKEDGR